MGRDAKRAKQARRDERRRKGGLVLDGVPPIFRAEFVRVAAAWDRAIDAGLMADGVMPLAPPRGPDPMPPLDQDTLAKAQAATAVLVRQGKVAEPVGAMVIPAPRGGVLFAVGGRDGELYVNGQGLTRQWTDELRAEVPELSTDLDRLQAMRAEWLDSPPQDRTLALAGACTDLNCHIPH